jgi:ribosome modulation factor
MSSVPQSEQNKRAWLNGWHDAVNNTTRARHVTDSRVRDFYLEGYRRGTAALSNACAEAKDLFDEIKETKG